MFTAILIACLVSAPTSCVTREFLISTPMPVAAYVEAQTRAARWIEEHPGMAMRSLNMVAGRRA